MHIVLTELKKSCDTVPLKNAASPANSQPEIPQVCNRTETVTEPQMTEPRKTEPRKTERRKTERRKTECRKGPNIERPNFKWD